MDGSSPTDLVLEPPPKVSDAGEVAHRTPEELVAKGVVPVKREFLCPPPTRPSNTDRRDAVSDSRSGPPNFLKEKKSKRQAKRERLQEQKSVSHICPVVAKSGDVNACSYKDNCRFSHDVEGFKAVKPADLEGDCPFLSFEGPCPYGLGCRYSGTHKDSVPAGTLKIQRVSSEMNGLKKDVQKLLWKNKMQFPNADAKLKLLGILGNANSKPKMLADSEKGDQTVSNGVHAADNNDNGCFEVAADNNNNDCSEVAGDLVNKMECSLQASEADDNGCSEVAGDSVTKVECSLEAPEADESTDGTAAANELRPTKKAKSSPDGSCPPCEFVNGVSIPANNLEKSDVEAVSETSTDNIALETDDSLKLHRREKKLIDFRDKLYLAPLTTVGNLPFRRVCKGLGADVTCGEMAMCTNLLQGQAAEWALLRRHSSEDLFGVQICGAYPDTVVRTVELIDRECSVDFIDINMGCPIDLVVNKGAGSALLTKPMRMKNIIQAACATVDKPITVKVRTGYLEGRNRIDSIIADIGKWGSNAITIHGRSRQQRYIKLADWDYVYKCARLAPEGLQVLGNGDISSYLDYNTHKSKCPELSSFMIARGALMKPWIFTEIKEQRHWDISSGERLDILKNYVNHGLQHWGSDTKGVETTRHFLLEWLSYTFRYVPVGLLDVIPQHLNWRPPSYFGRNDLETLMASESAADWIRISEMLLGKVPPGFSFAPKHKSNAYDSNSENG